MNRIRWFVLLLVLLWAGMPVAAAAQSYRFSLNALQLDVFINENGSASLDYQFSFTNSPGAHPIDYVDVGMPNSSFSMSGVTADVNGQPVQVSRSDYEGDGSGFAIVLGSRAIPAGASGVVHVFVPDAGTWLRTDSKDPSYASFEVATTFFGSEYVSGSTFTTVSIHFPLGVQPSEPRWHSAPSGFPAEPTTGIDGRGGVVYTWANPKASGSKSYKFGASAPATYFPAGAVKTPGFLENLGIDPDTVLGFSCCGGIGLLILGLSALGGAANRNRKMQYMPPKVAIEGMGIKRGLTAVEAATLMETPLDRVLTMILFGLVKKNAVTVVSRDPLEIKATVPQPPDLYEYEKDFIRAFQLKAKERRSALQNTTIDLIKSVTAKMKGFSSKETVAYYKDIMERAWKQVEAAETPEIKSENYDKYMEWTMLDRDYDDRTRRVFTGPVFLPQWWGRYDPTFRPSGASTVGRTGLPGSGQSSGGGSFSLPSLPGSEFAASMVSGVQGFSAGVLGDLAAFTGGVTNKTNPVPVSTPTRGSSHGGGGCACACACAGCACACAGGGR